MEKVCGALWNSGLEPMAAGGRKQAFCANKLSWSFSDLFGDLTVRRQFRFGEAAILSRYKLRDDDRQIVS